MMEKHNLIIVVTIVLGCIITYQAQNRAESIHIEKDTPWEVIQIGRQFLDERGYTTGWTLFSRLEEKEPNFYWNYALKFERPDIHGLRSCWVIRFEQAKRPGHFFEVWIDTSEHLVVGGGQCR